MRRTAIAAAWIVGAIVPVVAAALFLFGCCVLPFHRVLHKAMPHCDVAVAFLAGDHHGHHDQQTPVPARERQEPARRIATEIPRPLQLAACAAGERRIAAADATTYRSFIALGALRRDRDVGLHVLVATFLI